ncbi:type II toxin-antitoxin system prevent-host-death family antitoxin [Demequina sp. B12]|uniref:type II toxin-antitoxin system Phd/YefM family antitoxin n=1 Tax=Demequina sp. B12 TaxID=2992757 RepID=UPI00237A4D3A|nr:type II toxin-antitoxin system prevent-host-death family antitoxin [Demequina sp. B12]MDE0572253.1 type II toxin-antitoxin system prevent-host-death family antitoxin [Demequina sp. B12]
MELTVTQLRKELSKALDAAKAGEDVIITERGVPVARLCAVESASLLDKLEADGLITPPAESRAVPRLPEAEAAKDALSSLLSRLRR